MSKLSESETLALIFTQTPSAMAKPIPVVKHYPVYLLRGGCGTTFECANSLGKCVAALDSLPESTRRFAKIYERKGQGLYVVE